MRYSVNKLFKRAIKEISSLGFNRKEYNTATPIKLGFSQSDFRKISYITEKKQNELLEYKQKENKIFTKEERKKFFYHTTIEKLVNKFFTDAVSDSYKCQEIIEQLKKNLFDLKKLDLKVFEGNDIATIYASDSNAIGSMSCMQGKPMEYFQIYSDLPVKLYTILENGTLYARCLVWQVNRSYWANPRIYIDRIYTYAHNEPLSNHIYKRMIQAIMKANKIDKTETIHAYNFKHIKSDDLKGYGFCPFGQVYFKSMKLTDFDSFPYMDSFQYGSDSDDCISTHKEDDSSHFFDCTSGSYSDVEQIYCECCGANVNEDEQIICEDVGETRCEDCARYSETDDCYYSEENVTYIGGNVNSYVHNGDIRS
jgi:hypothetical protein